MKILVILLIFTVQIIPQWTQTGLGDAQYGYNLYSSGSEVFAATLNGVYSTTDNGNPWFSIGLQNRLVFDVITSGDYILAATENIGPGVFRSSDHGSTWLDASGIENQSVRAFTKNTQYVFACTWGGGIYRSGDNGARWQSLGLTNVPFRSMYSVGEKIFAGGDKIYYSTNNGDTWESSQLPYPAGDTWNFHYTNSTLYAADMGLYTSTDMGTTWNLKYGVTFDDQGNAVDVTMFKDIISFQNVLVASAAFNSIVISNDGGSTWSSFNNGISADWTFAGLAINEPYLWALRDFFGNAYLCPLTSLTAAENENPVTVTAFELYQNYPNPFNPETKVNFSIPDPCMVEIKVYDALGSYVQTLINENKPAGFYEVVWNAAGLPSGLYFYQLIANSFTETRKMILLK